MVQADLDGGDGGHRKVGRGVVAGQCAQCPVDEVNGVFGGRPDGGEGLLHRRQDRGRGGDRASRVSVADLRRATAAAAASTETRPARARRPARLLATSPGLHRPPGRQSSRACPLHRSAGPCLGCSLRGARGRGGGARRRWDGRWTGVGGLGSGDWGSVAGLPGTARGCGAAGVGAAAALTSVPGMVSRHPGRIRSGSFRCRPSAWWVCREAWKIRG